MKLQATHRFDADDARLHAELLARYGMEHETWAVERIARVMKKLNGVRRGKPKLEGHILGLSQYNAFTLPGPHLYISRRLLERCANDAEAAMILAHEVAHHDLGHLDTYAGWAKRLPRVAAAELVALVSRMLERKIHSQEHELAADAHALVLCGKAKFALEECVGMFDILRMHAIDVGDLDAAYGEDDDDQPTGVLGTLFKKLKRSHPSIAARKEALLAEIAKGKKAHAPSKKRKPAVGAGRVHRRPKRS